MADTDRADCDMADFDDAAVADETGGQSHVPLLRDPPAPPGYVDPLAGAGILDEPFNEGADRRGTEAPTTD